MTTYTIKYYKNRKMYSQDLSRYVNLTDCKRLIDMGHTVKFLEHGTDKDVTAKCLRELVRKTDLDTSILLNALQQKDTL